MPLGLAVPLFLPINLLFQSPELASRFTSEVGEGSALAAAGDLGRHLVNGIKLTQVVLQKHGEITGLDPVRARFFTRLFHQIVPLFLGDNFGAKLGRDLNVAVGLNFLDVTLNWAGVVPSHAAILVDRILQLLFVDPDPRAIAFQKIPVVARGGTIR